MISIRSRALAALALVCVAGAASAQDVQQVLKDVWVASDTALFDVNYDTDVLDAVPGAYTVSNARALAFEPPHLGSGGPARSVIAVQDAKLMRFAADETTLLLDTSLAASDLTLVNSVAVTDDGTVLFSGFSKKKRVYELWALDPETKAVQLRATGTPQLLDAVYVSQDDVVAATLPGGRGGLLAAAANAIMFFPEPATGGWLSTSAALNNPAPLLNATVLGLKGNVQVLSVDLVRKTKVLMLVTSERKLLSTTVSGGSTTPFTTVPKPTTCTIKTERLLVRNARGGPDATIVVSDLCKQVVRYDFTSTATTVSAPSSTETIPSTAGLVAIAVGEGNVVTCLATQPLCKLTNGFQTKIQTSVNKELLVLQFTNLCDPRVSGCRATGLVDASNVLTFNSLLPAGIQAELAANGVSITIPSYMFAAGPNGRFGALIVQTNDGGAAAKATVELDIQALLGFELGTRSTQKGDPFVRGAADATTLNLLNQDIVAYAPDDPAFKTVRGFEATPATTGSYNPLVGGLRGFSVVIYGLQHDLNAPGRLRNNPAGGLPLPLVGGAVPMCNLVSNGQRFIAVNASPRFYINLAACLMADQEELLLTSSNIIPVGALSAADRKSLLARLANVKDKLIKALTATGPNTGSTDFQSVASQLSQYDAAVAATPFFPGYNVYKNELAVRSAAFKFILMDRAYPSLPAGGFPPGR